MDIFKMDFLSLDTADIPLDRIINEYIPDVNTFIYELYNLKKQIEDGTTRRTSMDKFKLLIDLIQIYRRPDILKTFKELHEEKLRKIEEDKKRDEFMEFHRQRIASIQSQRQTEQFGDFWSTPGESSESKTGDLARRLGPGLRAGPGPGRRTSTASSRSRGDNSDVSEDEMDQEKFIDAINVAYIGIIGNSTLQHVMEVKRGYTYSVDTEQNKPPITTVPSEIEMLL